MKSIFAALIALPLLTACQTEGPVTQGPAETLAGSALEARLTNTLLTLRGQGGDGAVIAMQLAPNGVGAVSTSLGGQPIMDVGVQWSVEGQKLCTIARLGGLGNSEKDCVTASVSGDQIRLERVGSTGGTEVYTGSITPL